VKWLITGGAGYIGRHLASEMARLNFDLAIIDNVSTGEKLNIPPGVTFANASILDRQALRDFMISEKITGVIHLAGKKNVAESFQFPDEYYLHNTEGTRVLIEVISELGVEKIIFSSTAAVYKATNRIEAINESFEIGPESPYGKSKLAAENVVKSNPQLRSVIFRYFNVVGALNSQLADISSENLFSRIKRSLAEDEALPIYGNFYPTPDGTCVRDYIHVLDLVEAHLLAIQKMDDPYQNFPLILNLGTGSGKSVLEVIRNLEETLGSKIRYIFESPRGGDTPFSVCDPALAQATLGWTPIQSPFNKI